MSFSMYPDKVECDYCNLPRWKAHGTTPFSTHEYIPITHRLKLWYTNPTRAATMTSYGRRLESQAGKFLRS